MLRQFLCDCFMLDKSGEVKNAVPESELVSAASALHLLYQYQFVFKIDFDITCRTPNENAE